MHDDMHAAPMPEILTPGHNGTNCHIATSFSICALPDFKVALYNAYLAQSLSAVLHVVCTIPELNGLRVPHVHEDSANNKAS